MPEQDVWTQCQKGIEEIKTTGMRNMDVVPAS
jgi:hypothetical protein